MSLMEKLLNLSNSYQYYKTNYYLLKNEKDSSKELKALENKCNKLEKEIKNQNKILECQNKLLNVIFVDSNFQAGGQLRNVQLQTLELLKFVINICEENDLRYWLDYGTLLGSIRHGGFVPWDDEADIGMPREDYEKFIECFNKKMEENPMINEKVNLYVGTTAHPDLKITGKPAPCAQFVLETPLSNVDIHPLDYYDITPENEEEFLIKFKKTFVKNKRSMFNKIKNGEYKSFTEGALIAKDNIKITFDETGYMGSCVDGTGRKPISTSAIFPLKKAYFEGIECSIPNDPLVYLSGFYSGDLLKMPQVVHNHDRTEFVRNQIPYNELDDVYDEEISFWKSINSEK